jgi:hypothetical protein
LRILNREVEKIVRVDAAFHGPTGVPTIGAQAPCGLSRRNWNPYAEGTGT